MAKQIELPPPPKPLVPDEPPPLPPARGHGIVAERLLSMNGLISVSLLAWSVMVLRNPTRLRRAVGAFNRRFPWLIGSALP